MADGRRRLVDVDTPMHLLPLLPQDQRLLRPGRYRDKAGRTFTIGADRGDDGKWYFLTDDEWASDD